jgi:hypothetical protein
LEACFYLQKEDERSGLITRDPPAGFEPGGQTKFILKINRSDFNKNGG